MAWRLFVFFLLASSLARAQPTRPQVNAGAPIGKLSYEAQGDAVVVILNLESGGPPANLCDASLFSADEMTVSNDQDKISIVRADAFDPTTPLVRTFRIRIGAGEALAANWQWFGYVFTYHCAQPHSRFSATSQSPGFEIRRLLEDPSANKLETKVPTWYRDKPLAVPVRASDDVRVSIKMKEDSVQGTVVAEGNGLLQKSEASEWSTIEIRPVLGRVITEDTKYALEAAASLGRNSFATNRLDWFSAKPVNPYLVSPEPDQKQLVANSADKPFELTVGTSEPGDIRIVFEKSFRSDSKPSEIGGNVTSDAQKHTFQIDLRGVDDGLYPFHFEGKSKTDHELLNADKKFVLAKDTAIRLAAPISFQVDDKGILQIQYSLSRQIQSAVRIQKYALEVDAKPVTQDSKSLGFRYTVEIDLNKAEYIAPFKDAVKDPQTVRAPVDFSIVSFASDRSPRESILDFQLNAVHLDQATVSANLNSASKELQQPKPDMSKVTASVKKSLGIQSPAGQESDNEKQAIEYVTGILKAKKTTGQDKFLTVVKFVAGVAAKYFGIPVA